MENGGQGVRELGEKVASLSTRMDILEKETDKIRDTYSILYKISVTTEVLGNNIKENSSQIQEFNKAVVGIDKTLHTLANGQTQIVNSVSELSTRVDKVEVRLEDNDKADADRGKFDVISWLSSDLPKYIAYGILAVLLTYVGINI